GARSNQTSQTHGDPIWLVVYAEMLLPWTFKSVKFPRCYSDRETLDANISLARGMPACRARPTDRARPADSHPRAAAPRQGQHSGGLHQPGVPPPWRADAWSRGGQFGRNDGGDLRDHPAAMESQRSQ